MDGKRKEFLQELNKLRWRPIELKIEIKFLNKDLADFYKEKENSLDIEIIQEKINNIERELEEYPEKLRKMMDKFNS